MDEQCIQILNKGSEQDVISYLQDFTKKVCYILRPSALFIKDDHDDASISLSSSVRLSVCMGMKVNVLININLIN